MERKQKIWIIAAILILVLIGVSTVEAKVSEDDDAFLGEKDAPVTIIEFSDYQCPYCALFWKDTLPLLKSEYIDTGKVKLVYRDFPITSIHPSAQVAAESAECVREQGGDRAYFKMHDKIFENQIVLSELNLGVWARELGYDIDDCLKSGEFKYEVQRDFRDGTVAGVRGPPHFFVNGESISGAQPFNVFKETIDKELGDLSLDDPVRGDDDSPVTITMYADFQDPFSGRFYSQVLPEIERDFIETGKVKLIYKHFPLIKIHPYAQKAAEAAECAHEQGKFWEMHDKIFENQFSMSIPLLKEWAAEIELDTRKFNKCLSSGKMAESVKDDFNEGSSAGIKGTPAFFINGEFVIGAQPYVIFKDIIEEKLDGVGKEIVDENICLGCEEEGKCYPVGYRKDGKFCSIEKDNTFVSQLKSSAVCENSFECNSNVCVSGECVSGGLLQKILGFFKRILRT